MLSCSVNQSPMMMTFPSSTGASNSFSRSAQFHFKWAKAEKQQLEMTTTTNFTLYFHEKVFQFMIKQFQVSSFILKLLLQTYLVIRKASSLTPTSEYNKSYSYEESRNWNVSTCNTLLLSVPAVVSFSNDHTDIFLTGLWAPVEVPGALCW